MEQQNNQVAHKHNVAREAGTGIALAGITSLLILLILKGFSIAYPKEFDLVATIVCTIGIILVALTSSASTTIKLISMLGLAMWITSAITEYIGYKSLSTFLTGGFFLLSMLIFWGEPLLRSFSSQKS